MIGWFLVMFVRFLVRLACRVDRSEFEKLPPHGPGILTANHTSTLDGPVLFSLLWPRRSRGLAKRELWENGFTHTFMKAWDVIPVSRGTVDTAALRECIKTLKRGLYLGIAPEGTRNREEQLQRGMPGTALIALHTNAPIYPFIHLGFPAIGRNVMRLRKTRLTIRVGRPFRLRRPEKTTNDYLQAATDEIPSVSPYFKTHFPGQLI